MALKVYVDRMSQPSRAVLIFCKVNGIAFEEVRVDLSKLQQLSPEFKEVNPMAKVPAIVDGRFKLFESHAILIYLSCAFPGVADHWYPADLFRRAKINSVLDWHHSNLRIGAAPFVFYTVLAPLFGRPQNSQAAAEAEMLLSKSLSRIESFWLKGNGKFLLGGFKPSIADLSLVCEIMQLEEPVKQTRRELHLALDCRGNRLASRLLDEKDRSRILGPYQKLREWVENTRNAANPHFDEVHKLLFKLKATLQKQRSEKLTSKM